MVMVILEVAVARQVPQLARLAITLVGVQRIVLPSSARQSWAMLRLRELIEAAEAREAIIMYVLPSFSFKRGGGITAL